MKYNSIADIYTAHTPVRERFLAVAKGISDADANALPEAGGWSIGQIIEHVAIVEEAMVRICSKLVSAAREAGRPSDGTFSLTDDFSDKASTIGGTKVEAPERVHPTGDLAIAESLERLAASTAAIEALRDDLDAFDGTDHKFPHPFFGPVTAAEWLIIRTGHEHRHTNQIENLLTAVRN